MCVHQESNGEEHFCCVRALGRRYCYIRRMTGENMKTWLSSHWVNGKMCNVNDDDIQQNLEWAGDVLDHEGTRDIPVDQIDTHSLCSGGANALSLSGYSDC